MKKFLAHILVLLTATTCTASSHVASRAKVRTALNFAASMSKTALSAAKAHPYKTAMVATSAAAIAYAKYRHSWYDRQLTKALKRGRAFKNERNQRTQIINDALGMDVGSIVNGYLGRAPEEQLGKAPGEQQRQVQEDIKNAKARAERVRKYTFTNFLKDFYRNGAIFRRNHAKMWRAVAAPAACGTFCFLVGLGVWPLELLVVSSAAKLFKFEMRDFINPRLTFLEILQEDPSKMAKIMLNSWQEVAENTTQGSIMFAQFTIPCGTTCLAAAIVPLTALWLAERDRLAHAAAPAA